MQDVAFRIGSLTIHWYGILLAFGFWIGLWNAGRRGLQVGIAPEKIWDVGLWIIAGTVVGARALFVVSYWENFAGQPLTEIFMIRHGGLVYYGGLIGASLAVILYSYWKKLALWKLADVLAPSVALGYVFGRFGCLMHGCCFGRPTELPWSIRFPTDHPTAGISVHPTQVYDSILNLGLFAALNWLHSRKRFDGQVFAAYLMGYAVLRSLVELFRGDYPVHYLGGWATQAHLISIMIFAAGLALYIQRSRPAIKRA
jgi:phosphatidylglycerol:prolipoprotein diacylglycerol transferase